MPKELAVRLCVCVCVPVNAPELKLVISELLHFGSFLLPAFLLAADLPLFDWSNFKFTSSGGFASASSRLAWPASSSSFSSSRPSHEIIESCTSSWLTSRPFCWLPEDSSRLFVVILVLVIVVDVGPTSQPALLFASLAAYPPDCYVLLALIQIPASGR